MIVIPGCREKSLMLNVNMCHAMHIHRGYKSRIVHFLSGDLLLDDEAFPFAKSLCGVAKDRKEALHPDELGCGPLNASQHVLHSNV